jgi:Fe-S-cluster containining protein
MAFERDAPQAASPSTLRHALAEFIHTPKETFCIGYSTDLQHDSESGEGKWILLKIEKTTKVSSIQGCNNCGACCRDFPFVRLSRNDIETLENFTKLTSAEFTESIDEAGEKRFMKFKENGDCIFLKLIDGAYSCGVYEARPSTCRGYPSTDLQRKTCLAESGR